MTINRFVGDFGFLSNFYPSTVSFEGKLYKTVEHAYQAAKSLDPGVRETIRNANGPGEAKKLGRAIIIRKDWDSVKFNVMLELVKKKFENPFLRPLLLATADAELIEENYWNDTFWGICRGVGQNHLGKILMRVRDEIRREEPSH